MTFFFISLSLSFSDYGYKPADGFDGPCVRDEAVLLDDPCADGQVKTVMKSRGYRKVAGDVCVKGVAGLDFEPYEFTCCGADARPTNSTPSAGPTTLSPSSDHLSSSAIPNKPNPSSDHLSSSAIPNKPNPSSGHLSSSTIPNKPNPSAIQPSPTAIPKKPNPSAIQPSPTQSRPSITHPTDPNPSVKIVVKDNKQVVIGLGAALAIAILIAISLGLLAAIFVR